MARFMLCSLLQLLLLVATALGSQSSQDVSHVEAAPECGGELRLTFRTQANQEQQAEHVVRRSAARPVISVSYQLSDVSEDQPSLYKEFGATNPSASSAVSAIIRGLEPGKKYRLRVRYGQRSDGQTHWSEYGDSVEAVSGEELPEAGPAGVGESVHTFCQSRRRRPGIQRPKQERIHRSTFASASRRRRTFYIPTYSLDYTYYNYYYDCYYSSSGLTYYFCDASTFSSSFSLPGAIAGSIIGGIFVTVGLILVCCRCCQGCPGYRRRTAPYSRVNTTTVYASAATPQSGMNVPMASPVSTQAVLAQPAPISGYVPPKETEVGLAPIYPHPQPGTAPAAGGAGTLPYPAPRQQGGAAAAAAPPPYLQAQPMTGVTNPMQQGGTAPAWGGVAPPSYTDTGKM